jgi:hypothetical protein
VNARTFVALLLLAPVAWAQDPSVPAHAETTAETTVESTARPAEEPLARVQDAGARTMDHLELDPTEITGNRELPKVLVIVPWKRAELGELTGRPANSLLNEVLEPVDREVFRKELRYFEALEAKPET